VVLDCEGLFSSQRTDGDEEKLLLALAAVSDVFFLNQDLTFSRHLLKLFESLALLTGKLNSSEGKLFKGKLHNVIRDVSEVNGALEQNKIVLEDKVKNSTFLEEIFGGEIVTTPLHIFSDSSFSSEVDDLRELLLLDVKELSFVTPTYSEKQHM
jgi:hypothetical protein